MLQKLEHPRATTAPAGSIGSALCGTEILSEERP
jgi:hypothetical protein